MKTSASKLLAIMSILIALSSSAATEHSELRDRSERVLQTVLGDYIIPKDDSIDKWCIQKGVDVKVIDKPTAEANAEIEVATQAFQGPREMFKAAITTQDFSQMTNDYMGSIRSMTYPVLVPFLFTILSMASLVYILLWCLFTLCCCTKSTCCVKKQYKGDKRPFCMKIVFVLALVLVVMTIVGGVVWAGRGSATFEGMKYMPCALTSMRSNIVAGVKNSELTFIGLNGIDYVFNNFLLKMTDIKNSNARNFQAQGVPADMTALQSARATFFTTHNNNSAYYLDGATATSAPDFLKTLAMTIDSTLKTEIDGMKSWGDSMQASSTVINDLFSNDTITPVLTSLTGNVGTVRTSITNLETLVLVNLDPSRLESTAKLVSILAIVIIASLGGCVFLVLFMNTCKNKWHACKIISKIILLLFLMASIALNLVGGLFGLLSIIMSNLCYFFSKFLSDPAFVAAFNEPNLKLTLQECFYPTGNGDLYKIVPIATVQAEMNKINNLFAPLYDIDTQAATYTPLVPPVGEALEQDLIARTTFVTDDTTTNSWFRFSTLMSTFSTDASCTGNVMRLKGACAALPVSAAGHAPDNFNEATPYCFEIGPNFPNLVYTTRYNGGCATANQVSARASLNNARTLKNAYQSKIPPFKTAWDTLYNQEKAAFNKLRVGFNDMKTLRDNVKSTVDTLKAISTDIFAVLNCKIFSKQLNTFNLALCVQFGARFFSFTSALLFLGPTLFFFAWCICCGIRCSVKQEDNPDAEPEAPPNAKAPPADLNSSVAKPLNQVQDVSYQQPINPVQPSNGYPQAPGNGYPQAPMNRYNPGQAPRQPTHDNRPLPGYI
jgi:hypothetical protein